MRPDAISFVHYIPDKRLRRLQHRIILIGDAPPHESYRSDKRNYQNAVALAKEKAVKINGIGVYCDTACQVLVSTLDGVGGGKP